jgi:ubiquinone/menaquinone biosynthesis C-methylase UbiE
VIGVEKLHEKMSSLSLGDLFLVAGQAINLPMDDKRIDLILKYVEIAMVKRKLKSKSSEKIEAKDE